MAKKVVNVALHKKKPTKPIIKKGKNLRAIFKKFTHYMKTDSYMYSLLESTKPSRAKTSASSGKRSYEPILRKKERTWLQEVEEFLKCDCYMYTPLCDGSVSGNATKDLKQTEETSRLHDQMEITPQSKHVAFKHVLVERETVKRVVLQNGGSHVTGNDLLQEKLDKLGAKQIETENCT